MCVYTVVYSGILNLLGIVMEANLFMDSDASTPSSSTSCTVHLCRHSRSGRRNTAAPVLVDTYIDALHDPVVALRHICTRLEAHQDRLESGSLLKDLIFHFTGICESLSEFGFLSAILCFRDTLHHIVHNVSSHVQNCDSSQHVQNIEMLINASISDALYTFGLIIGAPACYVAMEACESRSRALSERSFQLAVCDIIQVLYTVTIPDYSPTIVEGSMGVLMKGLSTLPIGHTPHASSDISSAALIAVSSFLDSISPESIEMEISCCKEISSDVYKKSSIFMKRKCAGGESYAEPVVEWAMARESDDGDHVLSTSAAVLINILRSTSRIGATVGVFCYSKNAKRVSMLLLEHLHAIGCCPSSPVIDSEDESNGSGDVMCVIHLDYPTSQTCRRERSSRVQNGINHFICSSISSMDAVLSALQHGTYVDSAPAMDCSYTNGGVYPRALDEIIAIDTVVVPEVLVYNSGPSANGDYHISHSDSVVMVEHYVYQFVPSIKVEKQLQDVIGCHSCSWFLRSIGNIMIALLRPIPEQIVQESFPLILRHEIVLQVQLKYLGCHQLPVCYSSIEESCVNFDPDKSLLRDIQRFHKAVACWESCKHESYVLASISEWTKYSGGAYYIILPVAEKTLPLDCNSKSASPGLQPPIMSEEWKLMVRRCSIAAADLTRNLYNIDRMNEADSTGEAVPTWYPGPVPNYDISPNDLFDKVFCRHGNEWYVGFDAPSVSFIDVMKYIYIEDPNYDHTVSGDGTTDHMTSKLKVPVTFADHYRKTGAIKESDLDRFCADVEYKLVNCFPIARRTTLQQLLQRVATNTKNRPNKHNHIQKSHLPSEYACVLGDALWFFMAQSLPSVIWRLQSLLLAVEACEFLRRVSAINLDPSEMIAVDKLCFSPMLTLEALTPRLSLEDINFERQEMLGDIVLKFVVTTTIFHLYPTMNEGQLTWLRMQFISNANLYRCSIDSGLYMYLRGQALSDGKQMVFLLPSGTRGASTEGELESAYVSMWNRTPSSSTVGFCGDTEDILCSQDQQASKRYRYGPTGCEHNYRLHQFSLGRGIEVKAKVLSDHVEALIGLYFITGGIGAAELLISGLNIMPTPSFRGEAGYLFGSPAMERLAKKLNSLGLGPEYTLSPVSEPATRNFVPPIDQKALEKLLGYTVKDVALFQDAFHYSQRRFVVPAMHSFERLEFLGDAVLDCAVVKLLYERQEWASPGHITFQKSDATNNLRLAVIALELGYDKFISLSLMSPWMRENFADIQEWRMDKEKYYNQHRNTAGNAKVSVSRNWSSVSHHTLSDIIPEDDILSSGESEQFVHVWNDDIDAQMHTALAAVKAAYKKPYLSHILFLSLHKDLKKLLADTFEAVIGAIFLDSGHDLDAICEVVLRLNLLPQLKI